MAYAAGNKLTPDDLFRTVILMARAFASAGCATIVPQTPSPLTPEELFNSIRFGDIAGRNRRRFTPAEIEASIQDRYLISVENGRTDFIMRQHLTAIGMTPDAYRAKWGLPEDCPVVAPYFARQRKHRDKRMSLGNRERLPPRTAQGHAPVPTGGRCLDHEQSDRCSVSRSRHRRPGTTEPRASRHGGDGNT